MSSRNEEILKSILEGKEYGEIPQSRIEALLIDLKGLIERGGASEAEIKEAIEDWMDKHPVVGRTIFSDADGLYVVE